jgi:hypothetical protein
MTQIFELHEGDILIVCHIDKELADIIKSSPEFIILETFYAYKRRKWWKFWKKQPDEIGYKIKYVGKNDEII